MMTHPGTSPAFDTIALQTLAYQAASRILRNPVLAEEAAERAMHQFTLTVLGGRVPDCPPAWVRVVARRFASALLRNGWSQTVPLQEEVCAARENVSARHAQVDELCQQIEPQLTPRQREALSAAVTNHTTRGAARTCRMEPRDFRRYLATISRKARRCLGVEAAESRP
jgi:hypothetical protein